MNMDSYYCKVSEKDAIEYIEIMDKHHGPLKV